MGQIPIGQREMGIHALGTARRGEIGQSRQATEAARVVALPCSLYEPSHLRRTLLVAGLAG